MSNDYLYLVSYQPWLVVLSIAAAAVGAYVAIHCLIQCKQHQGTKIYSRYLAAAAVSMGSGIWSMHFIGMMALTMEMSHAHGLTALSLLIAIIFSAFAFYILTGPRLSYLQWLVAGIVLGLGIAAMHYTGMAAMQISMVADYEPTVVALSVLIAIIVSLLAFELASYGISKQINLWVSVKLLVTIVLGLAVASTHYTGMGALRFVDNVAHQDEHVAILSAAEIAGYLVVANFILMASLLCWLYLIRKSKTADKDKKGKRDLFLVFNTLVFLIAIGLLSLTSWIERQYTELGNFVTNLNSETLYNVSIMQYTYEEISRKIDSPQLLESDMSLLDDVLSLIGKDGQIQISPHMNLLIDNKLKIKLSKSTVSLATAIKDYRQKLLRSKGRFNDTKEAGEIESAFYLVILRAKRLYKIGQDLIVGGSVIRDVSDTVLFSIIMIMFGMMNIAQRRDAKRVHHKNITLQETLQEMRSLKLAMDEHDIVSITGVSGRIIYANDKFCKISGYSNESLIKQNHRIVNSGYHPQAFWEDMWKTISGGEVWHGRVCNRAQDGTLYWVDSTMVPFLNEGGKPYQYVSVRTDVTNLVNAEHSLTQANQELEKRVQQRTNEVEKSKKIIEKDARTLRMLMEGTAALTGSMFFDALVISLCEVLNVRYAFIAEENRDNPGVSNMLASWDAENRGKKEVVNYFALANTPCQVVYEEGENYINGDVIDKYSKDERLVKMGVEAYVGVLCYNSEAKAVGHLVIMDDKPIEDDKNNVLNIMRIFATRAGAEMERKKSATGLIASEKKFKGIFDSALDGMMLIETGTWRIISANKSLCILCGIDEDILLTLTLSLPHIFPEWEKEGMMERWELEAKNDTYTEQNVQLLSYNAGIIYTDVNASLIEIDGQKYILALIRDITERRKAQTELERAYRYKSDFLSNMTHELRTPLNSIIGFSKAMLKGVDGPVSEDQVESLNHISRSGQHLLQLINDILDISKVEAGRMELYYDDTNIHESICDAVKSLEILAKEKGLQMEMNLPSDSLIVSADKQRIQQVLLNLLSNAVKFTDQGTVTVTCRTFSGADEHMPVDVRKIFNSDESYLHVSVADTGVGIEKENYEKVFEEFKQLDASPTRRHGGTGLGMNISKRLIEMHSGKLWFESEFGKGTIFSFVIPMKQSQFTENQQEIIVAKAN